MRKSGSAIRQLVGRWSVALRAQDSSGALERHRAAGVEILWPGHPRWPFADDPDPPSVLFALGNTALMGEGRWVGVVGTRRCTSIGRRVSRQFAADVVAESGREVGIVSGLAAGIDAGAHEGALAAAGRVIGVVACGLDVPYPKSNTSLWNRVAADGLLLSESPLGSAPERWKFPARNRLIAALSDLVVVVESHAAGGALGTADEAAARGVTVGAVPGSVLSSASKGTNALLADGCPLICSARDVLDLVGFVPKSPEQLELLPTGSDVRAARPEATSALERRVLAETLGGPVHLDHLLMSVSAARSEVLLAVQRLVSVGMLAMEGSRVALSPGPPADVLAAAKCEGPSSDVRRPATGQSYRSPP